MNKQFGQPELVQKVIGYPCGCRAEFSVIGVFKGKGWNPIPCYSHTTEELTKRAEIDYKLKTEGKM